MKKLLYSIPALAVVLLLFNLLFPQNIENALEATMLQFEETVPYDSVESVMENATFYVKAVMVQEEEYVEETSYRYKFQLIDDYVGNMRCTEKEDIFYVYSHLSEQYRSDEVYYLFMNGREAFMANTIMYEVVDSQCIVQSEPGDSVEVFSTSLDVEQISIEQDTFENMVSGFVAENSTAINSRTADTFISDEITSLEDAVEHADAIWMITINSKETINPQASICEYKIDNVFRGNTETAPQGAVFNGVYPSENVLVGKQYYVLLSDIGNYEYEPFSFDFWLFPVDADETEALTELLAAVE